MSLKAGDIAWCYMFGERPALFKVRILDTRALGAYARTTIGTVLAEDLYRDEADAHEAIAEELLSRYNDAKEALDYAERQLRQPVAFCDTTEYKEATVEP